jgi:hypothetical protein
METTTKAFVNDEIDYALNQIMGDIDSTEHWVLAGDTSAAEKERIKHHITRMKETIKQLMGNMKENVKTGVLPPYRTMPWVESTGPEAMYVAPESNPAPAAAGATTPRPEEGDAATLWGPRRVPLPHIPRVALMAPRVDERHISRISPYGEPIATALNFDE